MTAHEIYALIDEESTVKNVCVANNYEEANWTARCVYGDSAVAVGCIYCPCQEGDTYKNGNFYAPDGTVRPWLPSQEQQITQLQTENQELTMALADMIGGASA